MAHGRKVPRGTEDQDELAGRMAAGWPRQQPMTKSSVGGPHWRGRTLVPDDPGRHCLDRKYTTLLCPPSTCRPRRHRRLPMSVQCTYSYVWCKLYYPSNRRSPRPQGVCDMDWVRILKNLLWPCTYLLTTSAAEADVDEHDDYK